MKRLLLIALLFFGPTTAFAVLDSGNDLYDYCTSKDSSKLLLCMGLTSGYFEGMQTGYECKVDPKVTRRQLMDIVIKFLRENPSERHRPAAILSAAAYLAAFQCVRAK